MSPTLLYGALCALTLLGACHADVRAASPSGDSAEETALDPELFSQRLERWPQLTAHNSRIGGESNWDGSRDGLRTLWYDNGVKRGEGEFRGDLEEGPWTFWYLDGQKRWSGSFTDGVPDGPERAWYENGMLRYEGSLRAGRREGFYQGWHENGQLWWEGTYRDGKRSGVFRYFRRDGSAAPSGTAAD